MPAPPALLDEDTSRALEHALRQRGFDVLSVHGVGPRNAPDAQVVEHATALGRVVITHNADDFRAVHVSFVLQGKAHAGIVCVPQRGPLKRRVLCTAMMLDWIATQPYQSQVFVWGQLQRLLERGFRLPGYGEEEVREALGRS